MIRPRPSRLILALVVLVVPLQAAAYPRLDRGQQARLIQGNAVEFSTKVAGTGVMMGNCVAIVEDAPEAVVYVLLAVEKYKHFIPRITESRLVKRSGWHTYAVIHTSLPWPAKDAWIYVKSTRYDRPKRTFEIKWWMLNGTMRNYQGSALIEPYNKEGTQSVVTYSMLAEPKTAAPDSMLTRGLLKVVTTVVNRVRLRLRALRKYGKMPRGL